MVLGITESIIENQEAYEDELPLDLVDDIKVIRRNSEHLLSLVNDVLDLTRAETSRMILRRASSCACAGKPPLIRAIASCKRPSRSVS